MKVISVGMYLLFPSPAHLAPLCFAAQFDPITVSTWSGDTLARYHTLHKDSLLEVSALAALQFSSTSHYYNWGAPAYSADIRLLLCSLYCFPAFFSCQDAFNASNIWSCDNLRRCESEGWIWMAFNSRGDMNYWIFLALLSLAASHTVSPHPESACCIQLYVTMSLSVKISRWVILFG